MGLGAALLSCPSPLSGPRSTIPLGTMPLDTRKLVCVWQQWCEGRNAALGANKQSWWGESQANKRIRFAGGEGVRKHWGIESMLPSRWPSSRPGSIAEQVRSQARGWTKNRQAGRQACCCCCCCQLDTAHSCRKLLAQPAASSCRRKMLRRNTRQPLVDLEAGVDELAPRQQQRSASGAHDRGRRRLARAAH